VGLLASLWWWLTFVFGCETEEKVNPYFRSGWFIEAFHNQSHTDSEKEVVPNDMYKPFQAFY